MKRTPFVHIFTLTAFLLNSFSSFPLAQAQEFKLPVPGVMVHLSPEFNPPILKGIKVHPDNPFRFDFILDQGDQRQPGDIKVESTKLIKYFLASLTIPENDLWVNLSPYEKDRIVPNSFGLTEMGRDLLAEDYLLKQITASLIYPEGETGKKFWKHVYAEAEKKFGTTNIPVNTFNKVWIVPEKAVVYENVKAGTAYVVESKLKVMLEEDYLAMQKNQRQPGDMALAVSPGTLPSDAGLITKAPQGNNPTQNADTNALGSRVVRDIVIPELTKEVNENKNFAQLRQVYNSLILATWYKKKIKDSILVQVYADRNKTSGVQYTFTVIPAKAGIHNKNDVQLIYQRYLQAFKKGVFNYIKEESIFPSSGGEGQGGGRIPRKYFSGGVRLSFDTAMLSNGVNDLKMGSSVLNISSDPGILSNDDMANAGRDIDVVADLSRAVSVSRRQRKVKKSVNNRVDPDQIGKSALAEFVRLRMGHYSEAQYEGLTQKIVELRKKFYPWVIKRLNELQARHRPLRIKIQLYYQGGGGQYGKLALLLRGLLSMHQNMEFKVEFMDLNLGRGHWEQDYDFTSLGNIPHLTIGEHNQFISYPADLVIGINTTTKASRDRSFVISVIALNHGVSRESGYLDENDLDGPLGTIILDPTLRRMREQEDHNSQLTPRIKGRQQWLESNLTEQEISYLPHAANAIWSFAHSSDLSREMKELIKTINSKPKDPLKEYYAGKKNIVIFSSDRLSRNDVNALTGMGITVIKHGELEASPRSLKHVPITIVVKEFSNDSVRELIGFHTGTLKRTKDNRYWVNFPFFITGNASWMEAISAGALWRHDNIDGSVEKIHDIEKLIIRKLEGDFLRFSPADRVTIDSNTFARRFISSNGSGDNFYTDLEFWTIWAHEFSDLMFRDYNRLVDILGVSVFNADLSRVSAVRPSSSKRPVMREQIPNDLSFDLVREYQRLIESGEYEVFEPMKRQENGTYFRTGSVDLAMKAGHKKFSQEDRAMLNKVLNDPRELYAYLKDFIDNPVDTRNQEVLSLFPFIKEFLYPQKSNLSPELAKVNNAEQKLDLSLVEHILKRGLGQKIMGLEEGDPYTFNKTAGLSQENFQELTSRYRMLKSGGALPYFMLSFLYHEISKVQNEDYRRRWSLFDQMDFQIPNKASANVLRHEYFFSDSQPGLFDGVAFLKEGSHAKVLSDFFYQVLEYRGFSGQYVRGEITYDHFKGQTDWIKAHFTQLKEAIASKATDQEASHQITNIIFMFDYIDIASVNDQLLTDDLFRGMKALSNDFENVITPDSSGQFDNDWQDIFDLHWNALATIEDKKAYLKARLLNFRRGRVFHGEDPHLLTDVIDALKPSELSSFLKYFRHWQGWYVEQASSWLTPESQLKLIVLSSRLAQLHGVPVERPFDVTFYKLMEALFDKNNELDLYKIRIIETYLRSFTWNDILSDEGRLKSLLQNDRDPLISMGLNMDGKLALGLDFRFSEEADHLIGLLHIYKRKNVPFFHNIVKILMDEYGLRKDEFDRVYNEMEYLRNMESSKSDKEKLLQYAKGPVVLDVGPAGGGTLSLLEKYRENLNVEQIVGLDISKEALADLEAMKQREGWQHVRLISGDAYALDKVLEKEKIARPNTIIYSSILHEIYSLIPGKEFRLDNVKEILRMSLKELQVGGRLLIRDGVIPEDGEKPQDMEVIGRDGWTFFQDYIREFKGRVIPYEIISQDKDLAKSRVRLKRKDAMEFLFTYTWGPNSFPYEVREQYGVLTRSQYQAMILQIAKEMGIELSVIALPPEEQSYLQPGYVEHLKGKAELYDLDGQAAKWPDSNMMMVFEKRNEASGDQAMTASEAVENSRQSLQNLSLMEIASNGSFRPIIIDTTDQLGELPDLQQTLDLVRQRDDLVVTFRFNPSKEALVLSQPPRFLEEVAPYILGIEEVYIQSVNKTGPINANLNEVLSEVKEFNQTFGKFKTMGINIHNILLLQEQEGPQDTFNKYFQEAFELNNKGYEHSGGVETVKLMRANNEKAMEILNRLEAWISDKSLVDQSLWQKRINDLKARIVAAFGSEEIYFKIHENRNEEYLYLNAGQLFYDFNSLNGRHVVFNEKGQQFNLRNGQVEINVNTQLAPAAPWDYRVKVVATTVSNMNTLAQPQQIPELYLIKEDGSSIKAEARYVALNKIEYSFQGVGSHEEYRFQIGNNDPIPDFGRLPEFVSLSLNRGDRLESLEDYHFFELLDNSEYERIKKLFKNPEQYAAYEEYLSKFPETDQLFTQLNDLGFSKAEIKVICLSFLMGDEQNNIQLFLKMVDAIRELQLPRDYLHRLIKMVYRNFSAHESQNFHLDNVVEYFGLLRNAGVNVNDLNSKNKNELLQDIFILFNGTTNVITSLNKSFVYRYLTKLNQELPLDSFSEEQKTNITNQRFKLLKNYIYYPFYNGEQLFKVAFSNVQELQKDGLPVDLINEFAVFCLNNRSFYHQGFVKEWRIRKSYKNFWELLGKHVPRAALRKHAFFAVIYNDQPILRMGLATQLIKAMSVSGLKNEADFSNILTFVATQHQINRHYSSVMSFWCSVITTNPQGFMKLINFIDNEMLQISTSYSNTFEGGTYFLQEHTAGQLDSYLRIQKLLKGKFDETTRSDFTHAMTMTPYDFRTKEYFDYLERVITDEDPLSGMLFVDLSALLQTFRNQTGLIQEVLSVGPEKNQYQIDALQIIVDLFEIIKAFDPQQKDPATKKLLIDILSGLKSWKAGKLTDKEFVRDLESKSLLFRISRLKDISGDTRSLDELKTMLNGSIDQHALALLIGLYYRLKADILKEKEPIVQKIKEAIVHMLQDPDHYQQWLYHEASWNKDKYQRLIKEGFDPSLWQDGITLQKEVQTVSPQKAKAQIIRYGRQLMVLAPQMGVELSDKQWQEGLSTFEQMEQFVQLVIKPQNREMPSSESGRVVFMAKKILNKAKRMSEISKLQRQSKKRVTGQIKFDFVKDMSSGDGVPGCFNPLTGRHKEMPPVHALEADSVFMRIFDPQSGDLLGNAVIALTSKGAEILEFYNATNYDLDDLIAEMLLELSKKVPAVLMYKDFTYESAGYEFARKLGARPEETDAIKEENVYHHSTYDIGDNLGNQYKFPVNLILTEQMVQERQHQDFHWKPVGPITPPGQALVEKPVYSWHMLAAGLATHPMKLGVYTFIVGVLRKFDRQALIGFNKEDLRALIQKTKLDLEQTAPAKAALMKTDDGTVDIVWGIMLKAKVDQAMTGDVDERKFDDIIQGWSHGGHQEATIETSNGTIFTFRHCVDEHVANGHRVELFLNNHMVGFAHFRIENAPNGKIAAMHLSFKERNVAGLFVAPYLRSRYPGDYQGVSRSLMGFAERLAFLEGAVEFQALAVSPGTYDNFYSNLGYEYSNDYLARKPLNQSTFATISIKHDQALIGNKGGIDLTPANMHLQTQNAGEAIKFHMDPAMLEQLKNAPGFVPIIISFKPVTDLRSFLGLVDKR